jgi:hypothetical protein
MLQTEADVKDREAIIREYRKKQMESVGSMKGWGEDTNKSTRKVIIEA